MGSRGPLSNRQKGAMVVQGQGSMPSPRAPRGMGLVARRYWRAVWSAAGAWLAPELDAAVVARLCDSYALRERLQAELDGAPLLVPGYKGQPVAHPLLAELRLLDEQVTRLESLLGLNPTGRARLGIALADLHQRESKLDELLKRRHAVVIPFTDG